VKTHTDVRQVRSARTLPGALRLFFRFGSPRVLGLSLLVWTVARLFAPAPGAADLVAVVATALYWPFQEWLLHVALLHWQPRTIFGYRVDPAPARVHRWHHKHPHVAEGVFLPVSTLLGLTVINAAMWWVLLSPGTALTTLMATTAAALLYEWVHFMAHIPYTPRTAYLRAVCLHHRLHHFKNDRYWFAFTVPAIDRWLGTGPDPNSVAREKTLG
jgi:hypothetical protein